MYMYRVYEYTTPARVQNTYDNVTNENSKRKEPKIDNSASAACRISEHIHMILCYGVRPHLYRRISTNMGNPPYS